MKATGILLMIVAGGVFVQTVQGLMSQGASAHTANVSGTELVLVAAMFYGGLRLYRRSNKIGP